MKAAEVNGQLVVAGPDSPDTAICPDCGTELKKRRRTRKDKAPSVLLSGAGCNRWTECNEPTPRKPIYANGHCERDGLRDSGRSTFFSTNELPQSWLKSIKGELVIDGG